MLGNACATNSSGSASSRYSSTQPAPRPGVASYGPIGDSILAQALADREGPRVTIHAQVTSFADSRRVRGVFRLEDDAYVIVGHIDADGVLRIAFPNDPTDDGFVRGGRSYQTSEFFAGFNAEYRFRARTSMYNFVGATPDAYDGGLGYVFVIASWRPMRFDRFQTGNTWDSFELTDENFMRDPRPAIYELATLLAGENREAYTVKFARFTGTETIYGGYGAIASAYSAGYCSGYQPFGFESSPFAFSVSRLFGATSYGQDFRYRGTNYYYDAGGDCYRSGSSLGYPYGYGYRIVQGPGVPTPSTPRALAVDGHRPRPVPQALPGHFMPGTEPSGPGDEAVLRSPEYRQRGLITDDASSTGPIRRQPRVEGSTVGQGQERTRPSIQDMVNRRGENTHEGSLTGRSRLGQDDGYDVRRQGGSQPTPRERVRADNNGEPRVYAPREPRDPARSEPSRTEPSPRMQAPERASPPARTEPSPRMQAPERTSPPPSRPEPRSEPASRPPAQERPATPPPAASAAPKPETPVKPPTR
jgi:hypothetical protein